MSMRLPVAVIDGGEVLTALDAQPGEQINQFVAGEVGPTQVRELALPGVFVGQCGHEEPSTGRERLDYPATDGLRLDKLEVPEDRIGHDHVVGSGDAVGIGAVADARLDGQMAASGELAETLDGLFRQIHGLDSEAVAGKEDRVPPVTRAYVKGPTGWRVLVHDLLKGPVRPKPEERP